MNPDHQENTSRMDRQSTTSSVDTAERIDICPYCGGGFVYPLDWSEEGPSHWRMMLRCPDCEQIDTGIFPTSVVEHLDNELDRAAGELLSDLRRITHANMSEEAEFFIRALRADVIVPSDF
jgi:hypothetical protein